MALAEPDATGQACFVPVRDTLLLVGASGSGKSTLTQGLMERLRAGGFQFCVIDPEGDYEGLEAAVVVGGADHQPSVEHVTETLRKTGTDVTVNLLGVGLADRPGAVMLPAALGGLMFITTRPESVSPRLLACVNWMLVVGEDPTAAVEAFCEARGMPIPDAPASLLFGNILVLGISSGRLRHLKIIPGEGARLRHQGSIRNCGCSHPNGPKNVDGRVASGFSFGYPHTS